MNDILSRVRRSHRSPLYTHFVWSSRFGRIHAIAVATRGQRHINNQLACQPVRERTRVLLGCCCCGPLLAWSSAMITTDRYAPQVYLEHFRQMDISLSQLESDSNDWRQSHGIFTVIRTWFDAFEAHTCIAVLHRLMFHRINEFFEFCQNAHMRIRRRLWQRQMCRSIDATTHTHTQAHGSARNSSNQIETKKKWIPNPIPTNRYTLIGHKT